MILRRVRLIFENLSFICFLQFFTCNEDVVLCTLGTTPRFVGHSNSHPLNAGLLIISSFFQLHVTKICVERHVLQLYQHFRASPILSRICQLMYAPDSIIRTDGIDIISIQPHSKNALLCNDLYVQRLQLCQWAAYE